MNIAITGAGDIGRHFAGELAQRGHDVRILERDSALAGELNERLDAKVICGDGSTVEALVTADLHECELFVSLTGDDATNLIAASVAKSLGAERTIARVRPARYAEQWLLSYRDHFNIDHLFCPERIAAAELAKYVRNPNRVAVEELCNGRIELQQAVVSPVSRMAEEPLSALKLPGRVRIAFVQRHGKNFIPTAEDGLQAADIVTFFGDPAQIPEALAQIQATPDAVADHNVVILGGGAHGTALAERLEGSKCRIRVMERDPAECQRLAQHLNRSTILNVDATSLSELKEEQVGQADFFIAVTGHDEDNVMMCLQAQTLGTKHTIALVERADYADVITERREQLGMTAAVSPRSVASRDLLRFVTSEKYHHVMNLSGDMEVLGFPIAEGSKVAGETVRELPHMQGAVFVAAIRRNQAFVPAAEDVFTPGSTYYVLVTPDSRRELVKQLTK